MDSKVAKEVAKVFKYRINFIRKTFSEIGFKGDELDMRTKLFIGFVDWELPSFKKLSKKEMRRLTALRIQFLTKK